MRVKKDQKGFTVVEVLIATAILAIVVLTVCGFILVGSRSYAAGNSDINVQQEAQLALNQMSDVLIDTTRSVNYVGYDTSGSPVAVLKDAEFTFTPEDKSLIMFNGVVEETPAAVPGGASSQTVDAGNGNKHYHFYWSKDNETLYYAELEVQSTDVDTKAIHFPAFDPADPIGAGWVELAAHVTDFSVDLSQVEEKRVVQLALTFVDGRKEYVTSNNVTIRNKVAVNDASLDPLNKKKTLAVTPRDSGVIIEPGETFHFSTPKVTGENVADRSVTWSLASSNSPSGQTGFTDTENGVLKVATDEPAGIINVVITTKAVDSDGNHASCTVPVNIKRATGVALSKTADTDTNNGDLQISPGCTFTISATIDGNKIGQTCSVCSSPDIDIDKAVGNDKNGTMYPWHIHNPSAEPGATTKWDPTPYIDILESEPDHATFYVHTDVPTSDPETPGQTYTVVIQAASLLSLTGNTYGRQYDPVFGGIELTFMKGSEDAEPFGGKLQYGDETLLEEIRAGLPTDHPKYVTAVRVVDNTGKESDKVLLYFTTGGGNNYRVSPDLFDLDLNGSYTFYMQAIDPVSYENRRLKDEGEVGSYIEDGPDEIWEEYISHLSKSKPYGYVGTKYPCNKVFYSKLDKPKLTFRYNEVDYKGKNITCDPVDIYKAGKTLIPKFEPIAYENIEKNGGMNGMVYSVYEGKGSSKSQWNGLYYFDDDESVMEYRGNKSLADGAAAINVPKGDPFMQLDTDDNSKKIKLCGDYHIVPGMTYQNKDPGRYEIIGCDGFDFWHLPRKMRYYEFDDSTIHVKIDTMFNLEKDGFWSYYYDQNNQNAPAFTKGKIHFPTPSETEFASYFDLGKIEWQNAKKLDWFVKSIEGSDRTTYYVPSSMRCRYVADKKVYELELFYNFYDSTWGRTVEVSAGVFQCEADGDRWKRKTPGTYDSLLEKNIQPQVDGSTADVNFTDVNTNTPIVGKMLIPLPSDKAFSSKDWGCLGFTLNQQGDQTTTNKSFKYQPTGQTYTSDVSFSQIVCTYNATTDEYTLQLYQHRYWPEAEICVATYTCKSDGTRWK